MKKIKWWLFIGLMLVVLFADQISKAFASALPALQNAGIPGVISLASAFNEGAAFSMGQGFTWLYVLLGVCVVGAIVVFLFKAASVTALLVVACALVSGGALGNIIDRIRLGGVFDFISLDFVNFPIFNVADIALCLGIVLFIVSLFRKRKYA